MIQPAFEILNQRGTPMFFSDVFANRPTAGIIGRIFISTDTKEFYRDTGTTWELIGGPGAGTITGSGAAGQVSYFTGSSTIGGSNNLFWNNTNGRLGINNATPTQSLDVNGSVLFSGGVYDFQSNSSTDYVLKLQNSNSNTYGLLIKASATQNNSFPLIGVTNSSETSTYFRVDSGTGYIGIGTATPIYKLDVSGTDQIIGRFTNSSGATNTGRLYIVSGTATGILQQYGQSHPTNANELTLSSPSNLNLQTSGGQVVLKAFTTGNVIIQAGGTFTDAGFRLDVNGTARVQGNTTLAGNSNSSSGFFTIGGTGGNNLQLSLGAVTFGLGTGNSQSIRIQTPTINPSSGSFYYAGLDLNGSIIGATSTFSGVIYGIRNAPASIAIASGTYYGIYSTALTSQANVWNLYMDGTANNYLGGKTLVGTTTTTGSGIFQVTNSSGDSHIQVWGTSSPSLRIDNASTGATQRLVMGLSTATNNFIQGSTSGDICISTASANPLLFGMWQTINATEVMRLSTSNNLLIGTTNDSGNRVRINGSIRIDGQTAATAGGSSGQHLIINCDGTTYKIALLNN